MQVRALLIGDFELPEFRVAVGYLRDQMRIVGAAEIDEAVQQLASSTPIDLILLALSHRSRFTEKQIRRLQAASPLSRLCAIVGSWCEGETRSGHAWPGVERLYVNQLIPRAESERWIETGVREPWPSTASSDEKWLHRASTLMQATGDPVVICSQVLESRHALSDACRAGGFQTLSIPPMSPSHGRPAAAIYDAHRNPRQRLREIRHLVDSFPASGLVVLIEYPRFDEIQEVLQAGGHRVLGKPFDLADLIASIHYARRAAKRRETAA